MWVADNLVDIAMGMNMLLIIASLCLSSMFLVSADATIEQKLRTDPDLSQVNSHFYVYCVTSSKVVELIVANWTTTLSNFVREYARLTLKFLLEQGRSWKRLSRCKREQPGRKSNIVLCSVVEVTNTCQCLSREAEITLLITFPQLSRFLFHMYVLGYIFDSLFIFCQAATCPTSRYLKI